MIRILDGLYQYGVYNEEKGLYFNGHILDTGDGLVIVDPPAMPPALFAWVKEKGLRHILVSNVNHARDAERLRQETGAHVWIHEADAEGCTVSPNNLFGDGDELPGGLMVCTLADGKSPGESALYLGSDGGTWFVGDALIGAPPGGLRLLPPAKYADPDKARAGCARLLEKPFTRLLLGDGTSLLSGAEEALKAFLK